jgi:peptidoglycan/xylan/chitin deacetylase (PgdA/CDA1 family)
VLRATSPAVVILAAAALALLSSPRSRAALRATSRAALILTTAALALLFPSRSRALLRSTSRAAVIPTGAAKALPCLSRPPLTLRSVARAAIVLTSPSQPAIAPVFPARGRAILRSTARAAIILTGAALALLSSPTWPPSAAMAQQQQQQQDQQQAQLALEAEQGDWSEVVQGDPSTGLVALTFDAGAESGTAAPRVIQILHDHGIKATFFLSGNWVLKYPDLAEQIKEDGHEIANHSLTHPDLTQLADNQIVFELDDTDQVIWDTIGVHTRPYFRPPFGARNARVLNVAAASGFRSIYWTLDSADWVTRATAGAVAEKVLRYAQPGDIVVEHVASDATAEALPTILDEFDQRGWKVGTVSEVLGVPRHNAALP